MSGLHTEIDEFIAMAMTIKEQRDAFRARVRKLEAELGSHRELMGSYNLGGWTDSERLMKERNALRVQLQQAQLWLSHPQTCQRWTGHESDRCTCGLSAFLAELSSVRS